MLSKVKKPLVNLSKLNNQSDWYQYVNKPNLSQQDKIEIIKIKSEAMEQRAILFEKGIQRGQIEEEYQVN